MVARQGVVPTLLVGVMLASMSALTASAAVPAGRTLPPSPRAGGSAHAAGLAGFQAASASFISPTRGFVLGTGPCGLRQVCRARLAGTTDGGAHWQSLNSPDVTFGNGGRGHGPWVTDVALASRRVGWLYGSELWVTRDGGGRWRELSLGGSVQAVAASSGLAYAVVEPVHSKTGSELFATPVGTNAWQRVGTFTGDYLPHWSGGFAVLGRSAWFAAADAVWTTADGTHWNMYPFACAGTYYGITAMAVASASRVRFLCTSSANSNTGQDAIEILASFDGGKTEHLAGRKVQVEGDGGMIAVPPGNAKVITFAPNGPTAWIGRSTNGGKTWRHVASFNTGGGLNSLSYVSATVGWIVLNRPSKAGLSGVLLRTTDAGRTWHQVNI